MADSISELFNQAGAGYETKGTMPGLQIHGGPHGFAPDFKKRLLWSNYIKQPFITLMLQAPGFFNLLPESEILIGSLKDLVELNAKRVDGLRSTLNAEYASTDLTRAGEQWQDISMVKRERSEPSYAFVERMGKPINKLLDFWLRYGIQDPDTGIPLVSTLPGVDQYRIVSSNTSMVTIHIEPDPTHREVVEAWLVFNQQPMNAGNVEGVRDIFTGQQVLEYQIPMTATTLVGYSVNKLAQKLLDELNYVGANASRRELFVSDVSEDVAAITQTGYKESLNLISEEQTP